MTQPDPKNAMARDMAETIPEGIQFGTQVRALRRARDMTLKAVADAAGLSVGYLSQIERYGARPSYAAAGRIARALGLDVDHFTGHSPAPGQVNRAQNRERIRGPRTGLTYELLHTGLSRGRMIAYRVYLDPGQKTGEGERICGDGGEELVMVEQGEMHVALEGDMVVLHPGDVLQLKAEMPRTLHNTSADPCVFTWIADTPLFGS